LYFSINKAMNTKEIVNLIKEYNLHPNKKLGQNFLCNDGIIDKILQISNINKDDNVLEIGPGLGALTEKLAEKAKSVTSVEIDSGLYKLLKEKFNDKKNLNIIHADFLKANIDKKFSKTISNLPYYCSSEILFELILKYKIKHIFVMLQKEMTERILSKPGLKTYGALSVTLGLYCDTSVLFNIDKQSFYPQPDVSSSFIHLEQKEKIDLSGEEIALFHTIVKSAFWGRRKTLRKGLSGSPHFNFNKDIIIHSLKELKFNENVRGEDLTVNEFKELTRIICFNTRTHLKNMILHE